ncbi:MAG: hypothetical protein HKN22_03915 [Bacteroidia bacterium]|nr:hypothetical protein [Bacteroidia bacterium]
MEKQIVEHVKAIKTLIRQMDDGKMQDLYKGILDDLESDPTVKSSVKKQELDDMLADPFSLKERKMLDELSLKIKELRRVLGDRLD